MEESLEELLENYSEEFTRMPVLCVGMQVYTNSQFHNFIKKDISCSQFIMTFKGPPLEW